MTQSPSFQTSVRQEANKILVKVAGSIDERSDFSKLLPEITKAKASGGTELVIDLSGITALNSIGVKKWISFLDDVRPGVRLRFEKISEMIVAQANVISSMLGPPGTPISSFAAPYICDLCEKEASKELRQADLADSGDGSVTAPKLKCDACGGVLSFDEYEEEYFFFLKHSAGTKG